MLDDNWIGGHFPSESERAAFTRGSQTIHIFADMTNTALDVAGLSYDFNLFEQTYTLSGTPACTPAVAIGIEPASSFTVRKGTVDAESIELRAGETLLDQATLIGRTRTEIGMPGAGGASLTLENNSTFRGRQVTLGTQRNARARADVHSGSRLLIDDDGRLVVGLRGLGQLRVQATVAEGGATLGLGRATLVVGETQDAFDSLVEVTGDGASIVQTVDFSIVEAEPAVLVGVQTGTAGLLRITSGASAELGPVRLGLEPLSFGKLELSDSQLSADGLTVGRRGAGELTVSQGAEVSLSSDLVAGEFADGVGRIALNGSQLVRTTDTVFLGRQGTASLSLSGEPASVLASEQLIIGEQTGADGSMTVNGPSGVATTASASLGVAEGASGSATVQGNAAVWIVQQDLEIGIGGNGGVTVRDGATLIAGDAVLGAGTGAGRLSITNGGHVSINGTVLVGPVGSGIVEVDATSTLRVGGLDAGEIRVGPGATIRGRIIVGSGFLLDSQKRRAAMQAVNEAPTGIITRALIIEEGANLNEAVVTLGPGGEIGGTGALGVDLTNNGMIAPGSDECSTAVLTMAGDYTQAPAGQLRIKLGGTVPGDQHDALAVAGLAALAGTLRVDAINGFRPGPGETFEIMTADSITGAFDTIEGSGEYELAYEANRVLLTVLRAPTDIVPPCVAESGLCGTGVCGTGFIPLYPLMMCGLGALRVRHRRPSGAAV